MSSSSKVDDRLAVIPRLRDDIDLTKVGLSVEEGFLASRIDGRSNAKELAALMGKTPDDTLRLLARLAKAGVVQMGESTEKKEAKRPQPQDAKKADYDGFIFPAHLMMEEADLNEGERKRVIFFHEHLASWTHYEVLQIKRRADAKEIKRAYFERSKEWHPDRFRRNNLGSFKAMIEAIFRHIQDAYRVLSKPNSRAKYDEENVLMVDEDEIASMLAEQRKKEREARREKETLERRRRRNPVRKRLEQARGFYKDAQTLWENGNLMEALRRAQMAVTYDPRPEYSALVERLKEASSELRVSPLIRRGQSQESLTNWGEAIEAFQEAVRISPEN